MFYLSILQKSESDLIRRFLTAQELNPVKNVLCLQFKDDRNICGIVLTSAQISATKKNKFRNTVYTQLREVATEFLISLKKAFKD